MYLRLKSCLLGGLLALLSFAPGTAALAADYSLFTTQVPQVTNGNDGVAYELGIKIRSNAAGYIKGIRFYKSASETGTHVGKVYSSNGTLLASVTFTGETASGWQAQSLATPLAIAASTTYTVSVNTGNDYYVYTNQGLATQVANGNLRSVVGNNGVYGPVGQRPTNSFQNTNYFRDVIFDTTIGTPPDTTAPTVSLTNPANRQFVAAGASVSLQATASDNVGVTKVEFYVDGNLACTATVAPFSCNYNASNAGNVANLVQAKAYDAANNSALSGSNTMFVSGVPATWQNVPFAAQNGAFTVEFDAIPSASTADVVVGLSDGPAAAYTDLAAIVRFGVGGVIDVRNGTTYAADQTVNNVAGTSYHFRMLVDVATKKYTVYVTPEGQSEILLAYNYSFRDSQSSVTSLSNRGKMNDTGEVAVTSFTVVGSNPGDTVAPTVAMTAPANGGNVSGTVSVSANAADNVGVAGVQFKLDGANLGSEDTVAPYSISWNSALVADGSHTLTAVARDAAGNTTTATAVSVTVDNSGAPPTPVGDGSNAAPACTIPRPTLLNGYTARPSWNVAGVDYCVGYPASITLKNPASISMSGVSVDSTNKVVHVTGSNITLNGYDFSNWWVSLEGSGGRIINSKFYNSGVLGTASATNIYVGYSVIDGANNLDSLIEMRGGGTVTVEYNWLKNSGGDIMQMHTGGRSATLLARYNLIEQAGMASGAHGDWTEFLDGPYSVSILYNTASQTGGTTQGFMVEPDIGSSPGVVTQGEIGNNTMRGDVNAFTAVTVADVVNTFGVHDNFYAGAALYFGGVRGGAGDSSSKTSWTNNTNMSTGSVETGP